MITWRPVALRRKELLDGTRQARLDATDQSYFLLEAPALVSSGGLSGAIPVGHPQCRCVSAVKAGRAPPVGLAEPSDVRVAGVGDGGIAPGVGWGVAQDESAHTSLPDRQNRENAHLTQSWIKATRRMPSVVDVHNHPGVIGRWGGRQAAREAYSGFRRGGGRVFVSLRALMRRTATAAYPGHRSGRSGEKPVDSGCLHKRPGRGLRAPVPAEGFLSTLAMPTITSTVFLGGVVDTSVFFASIDADGSAATASRGAKLPQRSKTSGGLPWREA